MHSVGAFVRREFLGALSYRLRMLTSIGSLLFMAVTLYFIANALQPTMAESIRTEGERYFEFVLLGMISGSFFMAGAIAIPAAISKDVQTGALEALLATPTRLPSLLAGMLGYSFLWALIETFILLVSGLLLGAHFVFERSLVGIGILLMIVLAYAPFGILGGALLLAFRTMGPLQKIVLASASLLGGMYYPTHVIPSWIQNLSALVPLTYGLRALRRTMLEGLPLKAVAEDLLILSAFIAVLLATSIFAFHLALRYARRTGTLAQY